MFSKITTGHLDKIKDKLLKYRTSEYLRLSLKQRAIFAEENICINRLTYITFALAISIFFLSLKLPYHTYCQLADLSVVLSMDANLTLILICYVKPLIEN